MVAVAAAVPFLAKATALAKGLLGLKGAAAATGAAAKGLGIRSALGQGTRFAGTKLADAGKFIWNQSGANTGERLMRLGPDALFGTMAAVQTPGDLGDKLIAGGTQFVGGAGLGLAASKLPGIRGTQLEGMADLGGSIAGDYLGMAAGDQLQRMKGGGQTAWEREAAAQDVIYRQQLEEEFLRKYGMVAEAGSDPFLSANGLG